MKKIVVDGRYTFLTNKKVEIGSVVVLPTPHWLVDVKGSTWEGKVTALESNYDGPCVEVIRVKRSKKLK